MNNIIKLFSIISFQKIIKGKMQKDPLGFGFVANWLLYYQISSSFKF